MTALQLTIEKQFQDRQLKRDFEDAKFLIADIEPGGFGAMVARRKLAYQLGQVFDRTIIFRNAGSLYDECYEPTSKYTLEEVLSKNPDVHKFSFSNLQDSKVCYFDFNEYWNSPNKDKYQCWCDPIHANEENGYLYFSGLIISQFIPLPEYTDKNNEVKEGIGWSSPMIGLHVRRGDKGIETGKNQYVLLESYMREVQRISDETGIKKVFVTSDSPEPYHELVENYSGFEFIQDDLEKRYDNANWQLVSNNPELRKEETMTGIKIIELLSSCDYIVGQSNTQFAKLGGSVSCYRNNNRNCLTLIDHETQEVVSYGTNSATS